jgi:hypothetical protein
MMAPSSEAEPRRVVVKSYGRGSLLGVLSLPLSLLMASRGMRGWQETAIRDMEVDAVAMASRGYRIVSTEERGMPVFGITYYTVRYEREDSAT